jgi:phosphoribosylanthranilate isomerase
MHRTRVKICGLTRPKDAQIAAWAGADALGLVFYPPSKRAISVPQAQEIVHALPAFVSRVGLWVNPKTWEVAEVLAQVPLNVLQFHGQESGAFCRQFGLPYIKALVAAQVADWSAVCAEYADAAALLLDSPQGGSGEVFAWEVVPKLALPVIIAGGLTAANVGEVIRQVQPYGVDVSSGVELAPGVKGAEKMKNFLQIVQEVDYARNSRN